MLAVILFVTMLVLVAIRPRGWHEAWWTVGGALAMLAIGAVTPRQALDAMLASKSAMLFLLSLLALSMLVGKSGFFDWAAIRCARPCRGKTRTLYRNTFLLGAVTTAVMSLDTTAVMLTPVVLAIARRLKLPGAPFVVACAFVANVGSLLLPISNLTNLLYADAFGLTFAAFAARMVLPQLVGLGLTFWLLRRHFRDELARDFDADAVGDPAEAVPHRGYFRRCAAVLAIVLAGYFVAPLAGIEPYVVAFAGALVLLIAGVAAKRVSLAAIGEISWGVFPFVLGLFVAVQAIENLGIVPVASRALGQLGDHPALQHGAVAAATGIASNAINNLPAALLARTTLLAAHAQPSLALAALVGADVGPMILPTGSLATILVLTLARRDGVNVPVGSLIRLGLWVTPIVAAACVAALAIS